MGFLSIDISFDGIGNKDRIYHNGMESTSSMIKVFGNLMKNNVKFRIRYTMHHENADFVYEDITMIIKKFRPSRLITSVAWSTLKDDDYAKLEKAKELFRKDWINKSIFLISRHKPNFFKCSFLFKNEKEQQDLKSGKLFCLENRKVGNK